MAAQTETELKARLRVWLKDPNDTIFTSTEKDEFLAVAINDPFVYKIARDASLTTVTDQASYTIPSTFLGITDVFVDYEGNGFGSRLDQSAWEEIDGSLYIDHSARALAGGYPMFLYGKQQYTTTDSIPAYLQEYVLHLAMIEAFAYVITQLMVKFAKNDITMAEAIQAKRTHELRAAELRKTLANRRAVEW